MNVYLYYSCWLCFTKQELTIYQGKPNNGKIFGTQIVTFEIELRRANFENDIASEKRPQNQNAFIKINDLGVLLGKEFYTQTCTQRFHFPPRFLDIIDQKCCILSGPPCIKKMLIVTLNDRSLWPGIWNNCWTHSNNATFEEEKQIHLNSLGRRNRRKTEDKLDYHYVFVNCLRGRCELSYCPLDKEKQTLLKKLFSGIISNPHILLHKLIYSITNQLFTWLIICLAILPFI